LYGGVKLAPQAKAIENGVHIIVGTPGRIEDLITKGMLDLASIKILVLDEADRMLDMGFIDDIKKIMGYLPSERQSLLFSATFSDAIRSFAKGLIRNPLEISVTPRNTAAKSVKQWMCPVDKKKKPELLTKLITDGGWYQVLVFARTRNGVDLLTKYLLKAGIKAAAIHSNKPQGARTKALSRFKEGVLQVLVATDIAARGLDIDNLSHVVNFDLPNIAEDYIHRIGRTGRAGSVGEAISLVSADEFRQLSAIERLTKKVLERDYIEGFEPVHLVPESNLNKAPKKPKKPKKPKIKDDDHPGRPSAKPKSKPRTKSRTGSSAKPGERFQPRKKSKAPGRKKKSRRP
jgi:ATP-dependent RNA helicase RhlE